MKKNTIKVVVILLFFLMSFANLNAQDLLRKISLEKQIQNSSLVVEGKVISKKSFWNADNTHIYTANTIEVYKVFKGEPVTTIEVITPGGIVGLSGEMVSHSLKLQNDAIGIFTLYPSNIQIKPSEKSAIKQFKPYGASQAFYKYNLDENLAANTFSKKQGIASTFYDEIRSYTKTKYIELTNFDAQATYLKSTQSKATLAPAAITFSPTTITAGTKSVLTISGTGFGATKGKVSFRNADDGGATYIDALSTQILTWTNTQITVEVPSEAGTGDVRVTDAAPSPSSAVSAISLIIPYSEINVIQSGGIYAYRTQHINDNGSGGYTFQMFTDFNNNASAKAAFNRALNNWRCTTGINWIVSTTATLVDVATADGTNVVRFDNGAELDPTELGRTTYYFSGCGTDPNIKWYVVEIDLVFDDTPDWNFGPDPTPLPGIKYDFETNVLHELGHGHQLGHVIDDIDVMNFQLALEQYRRVIGASNITAASAIQTRSTTINPCPASGTSVMTNHPCYLSVEEEALNAAINIYPNPSRGQFNIQNTSLMNLEKVVIYDISGRLISKVDMVNASRIKTINLNGAARGMYFVSIFSDKAMITKKIILE